MDTKNQNSIPLQIWLFACCALVFTIVIVGAITRLTNSGLSMVEWRPLLGTLPPMNDAEWARVFDLYKSSPEFEKKHFWMDLPDFKAIFFWEWFHRLLGRTIGLAFALPLLVFWVKGMIPKGYGLKFIAMLALGGLQGLMGWYMVKSGLSDDPYVSHYRLAAHLGLAFLIFSLLLWLALSLRGKPSRPSAPLYKHTIAALGILILTIFWGAYTAGLDAGLIYNEYPLMGGQFLPPTLAQYSPLWVNFFETPEGVQFTHRWLAALTLIAVISLHVRAMREGYKDWQNFALAGMVCTQFALGIATLLSSVHLHTAVAHQGGALILLGLLVINLKRFKGC
ncbi:MAG: COX15/CtaA family protein [Alphaproteobacteria bacterium]